MKRFPIILSAACLSISSAGVCAPPAVHRHPHSWHRATLAPTALANATKAATIEPASAFVNATAVMSFADGAVFHVYAAPERVTDIQLEPGETLTAVASGDTTRWVIGDTASGAGADKRIHILVKPVAAGLTTNLVITTARRTYHIALTSGPGAYMAALSWIYPQDALVALKGAVAEAPIVAPAPVAIGTDVERFNFDYVISGDRPNWRPLRAFDDGRQTYVEFPPSLAVGEAPPLFLVDAKGAAQLVNYRLRGRFYVVDRLFDAAEFRLGTKHQVVVRITRARAAQPAAPATERAS